MNDGLVVLGNLGNLQQSRSFEVDTTRSKLEIVEKRLNEIINGRYSDIETPKAIARQCKKEIGLE